LALVYEVEQLRNRSETAERLTDFMNDLLMRLRPRVAEAA
jgi:hypothetical protein